MRPSPTSHGQAFANWVVLGARQLVMTALTAAGFVALSHILAPSEFRVYGYATIAFVLAATVGDLGLGAALVRRGAGEERLGASLGLLLAFWLPMCVAIAGVGSVVTAYGFSPAVTVTLAGALFLAALQTLPTALLEYRGRFATLARLETLQRAAFVGVALALALVAPSAWAIAAAALASAAAGCLAAYLVARWRWRPTIRSARRTFEGFASQWWQSRLAGALSYAVYPLLGGLLFTGAEVGLMIWALTIAAFPALLVPAASRAVLPSIADGQSPERIRVHYTVHGALLLVALPLVAVLFVCAEPLTIQLFGDRWRDAIPLIRIETLVTLIGLVVTPSLPFLFVTLEPRFVKRVVVAWAASVWVLTPLLAVWLGYLAASAAQLVTGAAALLIFERTVRSRHHYGLLRPSYPGIAALVPACTIGYLAIGSATDLPRTMVVALLVAAIQVGVTLMVWRLRSDGRTTFAPRLAQLRLRAERGR